MNPGDRITRPKPKTWKCPKCGQQMSFWYGFTIEDKPKPPAKETE